MTTPTTTHRPAAGPDLDSRTRWTALVVLCLGNLMIVLDTTIVNVALPSIRADLGFSESSLAWVVNAYLLTFGGFLLLGGRLGDLFGQRRLFMAGIAAFTAASVACGLAGSRDRAGRRSRGAGPRRGGGLRGGAVARDEPVHRAGRPGQGDGLHRVRRCGRRQHRRPARRCAHEQPRLALDLPGQRAHRRRGAPAVAAGAAGRARARCRHPAGRRGSGDRHHRPDARGLRHRQRQRGRLDVDPDRWPARCCGRAARGLPPDRVHRRGAAGPAEPVPAPQRGRLQRRRRPVGGRDVRLVLPLGALPAAGPALQPAAGRALLPAGEPGDGRLLARPVGQAGDAVRHPGAAHDRPAGRCAAAWCCSPAPPWTGSS